MLFDNKIDELIKTGWDAFESDFDTVAFLNWKKQSRNWIAVLVGPEHAYTSYFEDYIKKVELMNGFAGGGILTAAKEHGEAFSAT